MEVTKKRRVKMQMHGKTFLMLKGDFIYRKGDIKKI